MYVSRHTRSCDHVTVGLPKTRIKRKHTALHHRRRARGNGCRAKTSSMQILPSVHLNRCCQLALKQPKADKKLAILREKSAGGREREGFGGK